MACSCGRHFDSEVSPPLDASFVQVLSTTAEDKNDDSCLNLLHAATSPTSPPPLCLNCIQRVERAIQLDTARLEEEGLAYHNAVHQGQQQQGREPTGNVADAQRAFQEEIATLEEACRMSEEELDRLEEIMREQLALKVELDNAISASAEERNLLLWEAKNFNEDQMQLSRDLVAMKTIEQSLLSVQLTASIIALEVDTHRGLRYPMINGLRLAYGPKGDLAWSEVQAAWALAGHLLLLVGTIFEFSGQQWKLVPLSDCCKLFYYPKAKEDGTCPPPVIFNLGHPETNSSKALLTWNAALSQTIHHARNVLTQVPDLELKEQRQPYEISPTSIGNLVLPKLAVNDDSSWAKAIHYMASNLLWLSKSADAYLRDKVGTMALLNSMKGGAMMNDIENDVSKETRVDESS